ncbi:MAG: M48 family metallopeptidase, partial [Nanoarchaeota archaeon]
SMIIKNLEVNCIKYPVYVHYENRKNTSVSIGRKSINIRIPSFLDREERLGQYLEMMKWARKKLEENPDRFKPCPLKEYNDGDTLKIGNENYSLRIELKDKQSSSARIICNSVYLTISSYLTKEIRNKHISTLLSRCIAKKRLQKLEEKIHELNQLHFNQKINKIFFKHNKSNWGSCSIAGNINISTRLLFAPEDILEYVCIHELSHLIEHNHSERFWAIVEKAMPNYKEKIQWLKENGYNCGF